MISWLRKIARSFRLYLIASAGVFPCAFVYAWLRAHHAPGAEFLLVAGLVAGYALMVIADSPQKQPDLPIVTEISAGAAQLKLNAQEGSTATASTARILSILTMPSSHVTHVRT